MYAKLTLSAAFVALAFSHNAFSGPTITFLPIY